MSNVAADFPTQASNAVRPKSGKPNHAPKAPSGQFDDLLNAIPDAPPEPPRERASAQAAERPQPARRNERAQAAERADRPAPSAKRDAAPAPKDAAAPEDTAPAKTDAKADGEPAEAGKTADSAEADAAAGDKDTTETSEATQAAVDALVPQAVVADPAAAPVADVSLEGDAAMKPAAVAGETPIKDAVDAAATAKGAEQEAIAAGNQTDGLSADDADVLSALAAQAQKGAKDAKGDAPAHKADGDKPAHAQKAGGEAAVNGQAATPQQADGGNGGTDDARPVHSDLAKVGVDHQRDQGDAPGKPGAEQPTTSANAPTTAKTPDPLPHHLMSPVAHAANAAATAAGRASNVDRVVPVVDVGVEVVAKIASGKNQFDIRLDPAELGRIHVRVNVDRDGNITTHMMADRPETLDLLRRDTQGLERALQDAGLKTSDNSLQFSLRDQTQQQQQQQQAANEGQAGRLPAEEETTTLMTTVIARDYGRYGARPSGLDIRV